MMTESERIQFIALWASPDSGWLAGLKPPPKSGESLKFEFAEIVRVINEAIPEDYSRKLIEQVLNGVRRRISETAESRSWPLVKTVKEAARDVVAGRQSDNSPGDVAWFVVRKTWLESGWCLSQCATTEHTRRLYEEDGASLWDLREAGFPFDTALLNLMDKQPWIGTNSWKRHVSVVARTLEITAEEADARERAWLHEKGRR